MKLENKIGDKPLWSQLHEILKEKIENETYPVGTLLPSEVKLMNEYSVSRITVRQAMDKLLAEGYITRERAKGTTVLKKTENVSTVFESSFSKVVELNAKRDRHIISCAYVIPPREVVAYFGLKPKTEVVCLIRSSKIDEQIVALYTSYINPITGMTAAEDYPKSLYYVFKEKGFEINSVVEEISASIITAEEKKQFATDKTVAVVNRLRKGAHNGIPVEYTIAKYLGEGYTLVVNNS